MQAGLVTAMPTETHSATITMVIDSTATQTQMAISTATGIRMRKGLWTLKSYRRAETWTTIGQLILFIFLPFLILWGAFNAIFIIGWHLIKKIGGKGVDTNRHNISNPHSIP